MSSRRVLNLHDTLTVVRWLEGNRNAIEELSSYSDVAARVKKDTGLDVRPGRIKQMCIELGINLRGAGTSDDLSDLRERVESLEETVKSLCYVVENMVLQRGGRESGNGESGGPQGTPNSDRSLFGTGRNR